MISRTDRGPVSEWWWTIDRFFLAAFLTFIGIGMTLSFAASPSVAERLGLDSFHFVKRHAIFLVPAVIVMIGVSYLNTRQIRRLALLMLIGGLALMVVTLFAGIEVKGSRRWLSFAGLSLQPSEFMKPGFVVISAWLFAEHSRRPDIPGNLFATILCGVAVALLLAQPDFGQTLLLMAVWGGMFFMAGVPWLWIALLGAIGVGLFLFAYFSFSHVANRIDRFLTGEGDTFQVDTGREAIVGGGWLGKGPGEGTIKRILPDAHTDFIFSVAAEEFGIILCFVILAILAFITLRGLRFAMTESDAFTRLAVAGLIMLFGTQSIINMAVNLQLMPAKGMTLPFISYGGSSLVAVALGMGFVLALTRRRPEKRAKRRSMVEEMMAGEPAS